MNDNIAGDEHRAKAAHHKGDSSQELITPEPRMDSFQYRPKAGSFVIDLNDCHVSVQLNYSIHNYLFFRRLAMFASKPYTPGTAASS